MKLLLAHNYYKQPGGEDEVFSAERALLEKRGHHVLSYTVSNDQILNYSKMDLAKSAIWNKKSYEELVELLDKERPQVLHVHNTLPLISPSIYSAANIIRIPVVQTVHNYRPFCLNGVLFRKGQICEDCIGHYPIMGVIHRCYKKSFSASIAVFSIYALHYRLFQTVQRLVTTFVASSHFEKNLLVRIGLPEKKIVVKPNLVKTYHFSNLQTPSTLRTGKVHFVGRLDARKGIWTLLKAIEKTKASLVLVGDGDLKLEIERWLDERPNLNIELTGWINPSDVANRLRFASMLVVPSEFYESFGNVIAEAFSYGVPVITTTIGAQAELVDDGRTGLLFHPGDYNELALIIEKIQGNEKFHYDLSKNAKQEFNDKYSVDRNYEMLMNIYQQVIDSKR